MRIAVIGAGIAGLAAAEQLQHAHEVTLFEAAGHLGGHARTLRIERWGRAWDVDTGFVVFNETTYPGFTRLLARLGVASRPTGMSFSVRDPGARLEYGGATISALFAQRRNLVRPAFLGMLRDILRFNREAPRALSRHGAWVTLGELVEHGGYGRGFRDHYLAPMGAAIWSASERDVLAMPARFFVGFFANHGLLEPPHRQLQWRTVTGGSARYVEAIRRRLRGPVHVGRPVRRVVRSDAGLIVDCADGSARFDQVVIATPPETALALLAAPTAREREVLGAFRTQPNGAVLHTCATRLPRRKAARASWNVVRPGCGDRPIAVTYDMSRLQGLDSPEPFLVTLNDPGTLDPARVIARLEFRHPVFTRESIAAQARHGEVSGADRIHYCGAWWRNGFHEDGLESARWVTDAIARRPEPVRA